MNVVVISGVVTKITKIGEGCVIDLCDNINAKEICCIAKGKTADEIHGRVKDNDKVVIVGTLKHGMYFNTDAFPDDDWYIAICTVSII